LAEDSISAFEVEDGGVNALKLTRRDDSLAAAPAETARDETDQVSDAGGEPTGREHRGEVD